jgi:hypothetical protein
VPSSDARTILISVLAVLLASCQPMPKPFQPDNKAGTNPLLAVRDLGGIVVRELAGLPEGAEPVFAGALVETLQTRFEIPAATSGPNRRSYTLEGSARTAPLDARRLAVELEFRLQDAAGKPVGRHRVEAAAARAEWHEAAPALYAALAERAAPGIAALVQDAPPTAAEPPAAPARRRPLTIWPVAGAPGDGGPALGAALREALIAADVPLSPEVAEHGLVIAGSVHVERPVAGRQQVEIVWTVLDAAGAELGKIAQKNAVAEGALDGRWGELARIIADSAAPGVVDMLRRLPDQAAARPAAAGG